MAGFVLPRYNNAVYIEIEKGDYFGTIDLVYDVDLAPFTNKRMHLRKEKRENIMIRNFTV